MGDLFEARGGGGGEPRPLVTSNVRLITVERAKEMLTVMRYPHQRRLDRRHVQDLVKAMRNLTFVAESILICQLPNGEQYLVNAQHRLHALIEYGQPIEFTVITRQCADMKEVGEVYGVLDIGSKRSSSASLMAFLCRAPTPLENRALTGIPIILNDFRPNNITSTREQNIGALLNDYIDTGALETLQHAYTQVRKIGQSDIMRAAHRAGVMAISLYIARYQPDKTYDFWNQVLLESHPERMHPTRTLANYLRTQKSAGSAAQLKDIMQTGAAWNNVYEAKKKVGYFKSMKDFHLWGTPWHKGKPQG